MIDALSPRETHKSYTHVVYRMKDALKHKNMNVSVNKFEHFIKKEIEWLENHQDKIIKIDEQNISLYKILENVNGSDYMFIKDEFTFVYSMNPNFKYNLGLEYNMNSLEIFLVSWD